MENVLLDRRQFSGSFESPKMSAGRCRRATPRGAYNHRSFPTCPPYHHQQHKGGAWSSAPALPYAARPPPPMIYSSPSLPLLPSNHPPLLPLPPTANIKYATFSCLPSPPPPQQSRAGAIKGAAATTTVSVPGAAANPGPRQRDRRRRPARSPPSTTEPIKAQKKKPLERATPLPPAPVVNEAIDDLEQEVARNFVHGLLHMLAPPPSSLPLPSFSLIAKASSPAPSCNVEAAAAAAVRGLLRL